MTIELVNKPFIVLDLDDTLYPEIDFLKSAYHHIDGLLKPHISSNIADAMFSEYSRGGNAFNWLLQTFQDRLPAYINLNYLLAEYRTHIPAIQLSSDAAAFIERLQQKAIPIGLITDGRSVTQRNKLKSLGIEAIFTSIVISEEFGSEKPHPANYLHFQQLFSPAAFFYIGDNTKKDFKAPLELGWKTICLKDRGQNVHSQDLTQLSPLTSIINSFEEIAIL